MACCLRLIVGVWIPKDWFNWRYAYGSIGLFLLALFAAAFYGYVGLIAIPFILLFAAGFVLLRQERFPLRFLGSVLIGVLSIGFMLQTVPGFHNPALIKNATISPDGVPYSQNLNFDKALIGFFYLLLGTTVIRTLQQVKESAKIYGAGVLLILACVVPSSVVIGYIRPDLKFGGFFLQWAWINLFFTCLAEEAFFRGFIQHRLSMLWARTRYGAVVALVVSSLLFGVAHFAGGSKYIVLATIAGVGYGLVYSRARISRHLSSHIVR